MGVPMIIRKLLFAALLAGSAFAASAGTAASAAPANFSASDMSDLQRVSDYLNSLQSIEGNFVQLAADGRSARGTFYLKKPGRVRFEYDKPNPTLIVADGTTVAVQNSDLHTTNRYPIGNTPLRLLLTNVDLPNDPHMVSVQHQPGVLSVTAEEKTGPAAGRVTMNFADTGTTLQLSYWDVVDAKGQHTTVSVSGLHTVGDLPPQMFAIEDLSPFKRGDR
jgi:outer membrane lipoprotein-sorting protein